MHFSRRRHTFSLVLFILSTLSACGGSDGSDNSIQAFEHVAVSSSPQPDGQTRNQADVKAVGSKLEPTIRPGVESPRDSAPNQISKVAGTRLFSSGFEEGVSLSREGASSPYQSLSGGDVAGFSFPLDLWAAGWRSLIHAAVGVEPPMPVAEYASGSIRTVSGRSGPTRALSLRSKASSPRTSRQEIAVKSTNLADEPAVFQRMWIKFDSGTLDRARAVGADRFYQTFWEAKAGQDFSLRLKLHYDDALGLIWVAKASGTGAMPSQWEANLKTVPVVLAPQSNPGGWHKVEIWLDRIEGRFKVAIDGHTLVDRGDVLVGLNESPIDDYRMMMVSSSVAPLAEVLFDDLEFWDAPPGDAWQK